MRMSAIAGDSSIKPAISQPNNAMPAKCKLRDHGRNASAANTITMTRYQRSAAGMGKKLDTVISS